MKDELAEILALGDQVERTVADSYTTTPAAITSDVLSLCKRLNGQPIYVPVEEEPISALNECFTTVNRRARQKGGAIEYGWTIWEWPTIMLEAEQRAIWITPEGRRVDITRKAHGEKNILFVPDPTVKYVPGRRLGNVRLAISKHPAAESFVRLSEQHMKLIGPNTGYYRMTLQIADLERCRAEHVLQLRRITPFVLVENARRLARAPR